MLRAAPILLNLITPKPTPTCTYDDASEAVAAIQAIYAEATAFLRDHFTKFQQGQTPEGHYRAFYPLLSITTSTYSQIDTRLSFGHVPERALMPPP